MIKCAMRRNLKYPSLLVIFSTLGDIIITLIQFLLDFKNLSFFILLKFFGEI